MARFLIVGSGATGVHFAETVLQAGHHVEMLDVGYERTEPPFPNASFTALKEQLEDPSRYFLGERGSAIVFPAPAAKPYGFPPSKEHVFRDAPALPREHRGFSPLISYARGGLAEAWTGGVYELRDEELAALGMDAPSMRRAYATVAERIGLSASRDDMERCAPLSTIHQPSLEADAHTAHILRQYESRRTKLNATGFVLGRSRVAVLSNDDHGRRGCSKLGRCLWGCPNDAFYTPRITLNRLLQHPRFTYVPGIVVQRLSCDASGQVAGVVASAVDGMEQHVRTGDRVILAAGAIATTRIYLQSVAKLGQEPQVSGLMDNRHVMIPFVTPSRVGGETALDEYQYHMLAMGLLNTDRSHDVHGQISCLKAASVHPIIHGLPFDMRTSLRVFQRIRAGLGVANIWLADSRRASNIVRLERDTLEGGPSRLVLEYGDDESDDRATDDAIARTRAGLRTLGCIAPRGSVRVLPRGSSVHYAGTLPITDEYTMHGVRPTGELWSFPGAFAVDGSSFRWLPAKNLTFSLMANAVRIAEGLIQRHVRPRS